jgi:protoheme IX farnesyltransferase
LISTVVLATFTNGLAASLSALAIIFYVGVYSLLLKRRTSQNIVWGGLAGCFPVVIGWSAVTGDLSWEPLVLFLVVFLWTPPHYWPLSIKFKDDYARADVPMLPVVAPDSVVAVSIIKYSWAMVLCSLALIPATGWIYTATAIVAGGWFLLEAYALKRFVTQGGAAAQRAMRLFHFSITYLSLLFLAVGVDALVF